MAKTREERISPEQKEVLLSFMEEHRDFQQGRFLGSDGLKSNMALWEILSTQLNSVSGPKKVTKKWQKAWTDLKHKIKIKANNARNQRETLAMGGTLTELPVTLTEFDERVLALITQDIVYVNIPEFLSSESTSEPEQEADIFSAFNRGEKRKFESETQIAPELDDDALADIDTKDFLIFNKDYSQELNSIEEKAEEENATSDDHLAEVDSKDYIILNTELSERLTSIDEKLEEENITSKNVLNELKILNTFMERIASSLESMNNKLN